jgi:hypothetical protein
MAGGCPPSYAKPHVRLATIATNGHGDTQQLTAEPYATRLAEADSAKLEQLKTCASDIFLTVSQHSEEVALIL